MPIKLYDIVGPPGFAYSKNLGGMMEQVSPDIVHIQGIYLYSSFVNYTYCKRHKIPYLISPRGMLDKWILNTRPLKKKLGFMLYEGAHLKNAACLHALGEPEYEAIREFGLKSPIAVVPNGVFLPGPAANAKKSPNWHNDDRKSMLFLSRLHPKKGIENLLKAWSLLTHERSQWKLIIAGESSTTQYLQELNALKEKLGLNDDAYFVGPQFHDDKDITFRSADAFILPSYSEGMPMAILEAWSYELPVLMTSECNLPEGFSENAAIQIKADPDDIHDKLRKVFSMNSEDLQNIGLNGLNLVKSKYTWSQIAVNMAAVYSWILNPGSQPPACVRFD